MLLKLYSAFILPYKSYITNSKKVILTWQTGTLGNDSISKGINLEKKEIILGVDVHDINFIIFSKSR